MKNIIPSVLHDTRKTLHGSSTIDAVEMLSLAELSKELREKFPDLYKKYYTNFNVAGNKYNDALRVIERLMKECNMQDELYKEEKP